MKLADIGNKQDCRSATPWFRSLDRVHQAKVIYSYFQKIRTLTNPDLLDLYITQVEHHIAQPIPARLTPAGLTAIDDSAYDQDPPPGYHEEAP